MPLWGNNDLAAQSAIFAVSAMNKAPTAANRNALFGNTTANGYGTSTTVGQYGVDATEMRATRAGADPRPAHAGWVLRKTGQGGRAGRITHEVLVAMSGGMSGDAENTSFQQVGVQVLTNPASAVGDVSNADIVKFNANGQAVPSGSVTYQWQKWGGASFANVANAGAYSNVTTSQLSVAAATASNNEIYRCGIYATGATTKFTSNASIVLVP